MRFLLLPLLLCGCELIVHFDPPPETGAQCDDGLDNDNDGNIDCDDDGCAAVVACMGPRCGDGNLDLPNPRLAAVAPLPVAAAAVAAGDLDGDGRADLLVAQGGSVTILRNTGPGQFQPGTPVTVGGTLVALAIGDLDGDGDLDAVAVDTAGNQVFPLINARGTLTPGTPVTVGLSPRGIVLFDFDRDGDLDAATADGVDFDGGTTLENMGGTLTRRSTLDDAGPVAAIGAADLDGDRELDLVAAVPDNDQVRAYRNTDGGFFGFNSSAAAGTMPTSLVVLDVNGDRRPDVVTGSADTGSLSVLITDPQGILGAGVSLAVPGATSVTGLAVGDFDRDGIDDLVVATGSRLVLFIGNGSTGFTAGAEVTASSEVGAPITLFADPDVRLDVAAPVADGTVAVALGDGEECDDGNRVGGDACLPDCTLPATPLFARQIGGAQDDLATDVAVDDDDNVYVVGSFQGDLNIGGAPPITSQGGTDFFVASFTPDGTLRWRAAFGGQMEDTALGVAVDPRSNTLVVVGQAGPSSYGGENSIQFDEQAFALTMSSLDGTPFFVQTLTDRSSTGRASSVAFAPDGFVLVGGRFDGTRFVGSVPITGPGGFVADLQQGGFQPFTGNPNNEVVRLRADGPNVEALLMFAGRVPELGLNSDGGRDLALVTIEPGNQLGRVAQLGGGGDAIPGDLASCRPHALWLVTSFSGDFSVGGLTAQGTSDIATVRVDLDGNLTGAAVAGPGAETAFSDICDARQNLLIGGSLTLFDRTNAIGSFALDGSPIWGLPSVLSPLRMARDSRGFVYVVGGISAPLSWGAQNLTPFGSNDGVLAKFRP